MKKNNFPGSEGPGKKGYVMILDAIIALTLILMMFTVIVSVQDSSTSKISSTSFKSIHYVSEDVLDVLNKQGALDYIGTDWAAANGSAPAWSNESNVSLQYMDKLIPRIYGYRLEIDGLPVYDSTGNTSSGRPANSSITSQTHSSRLLVGFGRGMPTRGQVARAYLSNIGEKVTSTYSYFGGFEGQGDLTKKVELPDGMDTINSICLEYDAGDNFNLAIDGNIVPATFSKSPGNMAAAYQCVSNPTSYIPPGFGGTHNFTITFTGSDLSNQYMGGGYIKIEYNTSEFDELPDTGVSRYNFPGIDGLINLYSSFYVPGAPLNSMSLHLRFDNNYSTYLNIGNTEVLDTDDTNNREFCSISSDNRSYNCDIPDANLSQMFGGSHPYSAALSQNTIPLRMGVRNISALIAGIDNADVVLITDMSGSMDYEIGADTSGGHNRSCTDPDLYDTDTSRIALARCLDSQFIDAILNNSINATHNRVGLVGFSTDADVYYVPLTKDNATLKGEVNSYSAGGGTCLCCAINRAIKLLNIDETVIIPMESSNWKHKDVRNGSSSQWCGNTCNPAGTYVGSCNILNWYGTTYNDAAWSTINLPDSYHTDHAVAYYRKRFNLSAPGAPGGNTTLLIANQNGAECYLNGYLIGRDTSCNDGEYWDNTWQVNASFFNSTGTGNLLACRVRVHSNDIFFDVRLSNSTNTTSTNKKYIITMTDGMSGYTCGTCGTQPTCPGTCTDTFGAQDCHTGTCCSGTGGTECTNTRCDNAGNDAICTACSAYSQYGIKVYSVGFGPVISCTKANYTLTNIAQCGHATYFGSSDPNQLRFIYGAIAEAILNVTNRSQTINITSGDMAPSILYPESYIEFGYTPISNATYGEISVTDNKTLFSSPNNCNSNLSISPIVTAVSDAKVTSYSGEHWTDYLRVNGIEIYNLSSSYPGTQYMDLGDPYIVQIPTSNIRTGQNNSIYLRTADSPTINTNCSVWDQIIYTMRLSGRVAYGDVFPDRNGCKWTIDFFGGTTLNETIPSTYTGNRTCFYTASNHGMGTNVTNDAINDAIYRLLDGLDANNDGVVDVKFNTNQVEFAFSQAGGVRSLWGPINIKLVVWM
jgi:hypothetical protein